MDNITMLHLLPPDDVIEIGHGFTESSISLNPYLQNTTDPSLDMYNTTQKNGTTSDGSEEIKLSLTALWVYFTARILWGGLAIFANSLTILAVIRYERLQTCTNYLICSLAVSDLVASFAVPFIIIYELCPNNWYFIPTCLFQKTLSLLSSGGNQWNILYLSIDRYIYIAFPLRYHSLVTPQRILTLLAITASFSVISTPIIVFTANNLQLGMPCKHQIFDDWVGSKMAVEFLLSLALIIWFNLAIAKIAYKQARQSHAEQQPFNTLDRAINQSTKKISRTLALILGVYLFSYMPQFILVGIASGRKQLLYLDRFTTLFYWSNTWINPLVYAWRLKDFKIAFRKILTGRGSFNEVV